MLSFKQTSQDFRDAGERDYAESVLGVWEWSIAKVFFTLAVFSWVPPAFFWWRQDLSARHGAILILYAFLRAMVIGIMFLKGKLKSWARPAIFWMMIVGQFVWMFVAMIPHDAVTGARVTMRSWVIIMFLGNVFMPLRRFYHRIVLVVSMATVMIGLLGYPNYYLACFLALIAVMVGQIAQLFMQKALAVDAVKTYREKFQFIPRQVLLEAARLSKPISEVFRPDLRFCVCVCVDWNDFKKIVNERAPTDVGLRVVEFYQDVSRSLERSLPAGNYFVDWIADELFIVIFARSQADDAGMCASALGLARDLCGVRQNFTRRNGYPDGITVGIAAGVSMVGVFGAEGIAKATAFGETPGIARRLQSVAKRDIDQSVRRDRVVMNERFTALIDAAEEQIEKIPVRHALKDLSVDHLRVLKTEKLTREG